MPMPVASTLSIGIMSSPASTRGTTSLRIGSVPSARSAAIWSVTSIEPISAAMPEPTRPDDHQPGQHRPELLHHRRADQAADHRARAELVERDAGLSASTIPVKSPASSTTVSEPMPIESNCSMMSR